MLYWLGPSCEQLLRWVSIGALVFAVGWLIASAVINFYVSQFDSYNRIYGALGFVIILFVWFYWTNMLVLIGGQMNQILTRIDENGGPGEIKAEERGSQAQP